MVKQVANVIQKIDSLPPNDQKLFSQYLADHFDEVLDEARWDQLLIGSSAILDRFAVEVDEAIRSGDVAELNPDEL